jgi:hypothetical protein
MATISSGMLLLAGSCGEQAGKAGHTRYVCTLSTPSQQQQHVQLQQIGCLSNDGGVAA